MAAEVTFICTKWPRLKIVYKRSNPQVVLNEQGQQVLLNSPERYIEFKNSVFKTSDPQEINFIRNHSNFTGIREDGLADKKVIFEREGADQNLMYLQRLIQTHGAGAVVERLNNPYPQQQSPQADPAAATAQYVSQSRSAQKTD